MLLNILLHLLSNFILIISIYYYYKRRHNYIFRQKAGMISQMELSEGVVRQGGSELHTYWNDSIQPFYPIGHTEMLTEVY